MPPSAARSMIAIEVSSSHCSPNVIVPRHCRDTCRPLRPSRTCSMTGTLPPSSPGIHCPGRYCRFPLRGAAGFAAHGPDRHGADPGPDRGPGRGAVWRLAARAGTNRTNAYDLVNGLMAALLLARVGQHGIDVEAI